MSVAVRLASLFEAFEAAKFRAWDLHGHDWAARAALTDDDVNRLRELYQEADARGFGKMLAAAGFQLGFDHQSLGHIHRALKINAG